MKSFILLASVVGLTVFSTSCKKESKTNDTPKFTATVDGKPWSVTSFSAMYVNSIWVMTAKGSDGATTVVRVKLFAGNETSFPYNIAYNDANSAGTFTEKANDPAFTTNQWTGAKPFPGTITFTKFDVSGKKASGTFKIEVIRVLDNKTHVIEGSFENLAYEDKLPPTPGKTMTAKVDGVNWTASNVTGVASSITDNIGLVGNASNGTTVALFLPDDVVAGTYDIEAFGDYAAQYNQSSSTFFQATSGKVVVTEHDNLSKVVKCTFNFVGKNGSDSVKVTSGVVVCTY